MPTAKPVRSLFAFRFSLRTLLAGPIGAWGWAKWQAYQEERRQAMAREADLKVLIQRQKAAQNLAALTAQYGGGQSTSPHLREKVIRVNEELARESANDND